MYADPDGAPMASKLTRVHIGGVPILLQAERVQYEAQ
jgi:hypothetical protein